MVGVTLPSISRDQYRIRRGGRGWKGIIPNSLWYGANKWEINRDLINERFH